MMKLNVPMERSLKIRPIKKNDSKNSFQMKKLWVFEEKLLKMPMNHMNVEKLMIMLYFKKIPLLSKLNLIISLLKKDNFM